MSNSPEPKGPVPQPRHKPSIPPGPEQASPGGFSSPKLPPSGSENGCDRCGAEMFRMHAVWRCPRCGYKTDCCGW